MTCKSRCSICNNTGHTKRKCPYCCDPEMNTQAVYCYDCTYVSIPYKRLIVVYDVEGKKHDVNNEFCGLCESKEIVKLKTKKVTIKKKIKKHTKHSTESKESIEKETCCICFEEYGNNTNFAVTLCGHKFCLQCILKHSKEQDKCPMCRTNLFIHQEKKVHEEWKVNLLLDIRDRIAQ